MQNECYSLEKFVEAEKRIRAAEVIVTPIKRSVWLSNAIEGNVYLKLEFFQPSSSFKVRGVTNYLLSYFEKNKKFPTKVVASSGESHGIAVAAVCQKFKIACEVFVPFHSYSEERRSLFEDKYEAKLTISGETFQDSTSEATEKSKEEGVCFIHPFEDPWVIQGQGTMFLEIIDQMKGVNNIDSILATVGAGGLLSGLIEASQVVQSNNQIDFYSVEAKGADYYNQSHLQQKLVTLHDIHSITQPMGVTSPTPEIFQRFERSVKRPLVVEDTDVVEAIFKVLDTEKMLLDPSSASVVSALLKHSSLFKGKNVLLVLSSANTTIEECIEWKRQFFPLEY